MKRDIEEIVLDYKQTPSQDKIEELLKTMEPLVKYWCQSQCYLPWEKEDLQQIARIAVVGALERFDPSKEIRFKTFAYRTVLGKIMNYYRDHTWRVVIPRKYREISSRISRAEGEYYQKYGDSPTTDQLAELLEMDKKDLKEVLEAKQASQTTSLSEQMGDDENNAPELYLGALDNNLDKVEIQKDLKSAMEVLSEQQKQVIYYRFFEDWTQTKVAKLLGVSQMQVSRLEKSALEKIRTEMAFPME